MDMSLFERAFRLAYFLHPDRGTALLVAREALAGAEIVVSTQDRRRRYVPLGRRIAVRGRRRARRDRISMNRAQTVQRLVYSESERYERVQEATSPPGRPTVEDMTIRFLAYLTRITIGRNALYPCVGFGRLLFRYSTAETARLYELLVQDPDRYPDLDYYRSRKRLLLDQLLRRFGSMLETVRGPGGEVMLRSAEDSQPLRDLAREALRRLVPWETACMVPTSFDPLADELDVFQFRGGDPDAENLIEVQRMHAVLHLDCLARLALALRLADPDSRLTLPEFNMALDHDADHDRWNDPDLHPAERDAMVQALRQRAGARRRASVAVLCVLVDGEEVGRFAPAEVGSIQRTIQAGAECVEVRTEDGVPLAICLLGETTEATRPTLVLERGEEIRFVVAPEPDDQVRIEIDFRETRVHRAVALAWRRWRVRSRRGTSLVRVVATVTIAMVAALGWMLASPDVPSAVDPAREERLVVRGGGDDEGVALAEVGSIRLGRWVEDPSGVALRRMIVERLRGHDRLRLVGGDEKADALLVLEKAESPGDGLRLVLINRAGTVLWRGALEGETEALAHRFLDALDEG